MSTSQAIVQSLIVLLSVLFGFAIGGTRKDGEDL